MRNNSKISVIIPCRNENRYIQSTIESLFKQEGIEEIEILVVDGISEDGTRDILKQLSSKDKRLKIIDNYDKITPVALNKGILKATGDFICILGAHAEYAPDFLMNCLKLMEKHPEADCVGGPIISEGKNIISKGVALAMSSKIGVGNANHRFTDYEGFAEMACFPMFRKDVFKKIGLYDERLIRNQDDEFCFRLRLAGGKVYISPIVRSIYYVRNSFISLFKQYFQYGFWRIAVLKKHKTPISIRQQIPFAFYSLMILMAISGILFNNFSLSIFLPLFYICALLLFSLRVVLKESILIGCSFFLAVIILHSSYALGFFKGLLNKWTEYD